MVVGDSQMVKERAQWSELGPQIRRRREVEAVSQGYRLQGSGGFLLWDACRERGFGMWKVRCDESHYQGSGIVTTLPVSPRLQRNLSVHGAM